KGLAGAVIEGGARDVDEINDCGFAVIARHFVPIGAKTRIRLVACNVPVKVDGIAVTPGDIVVADSSAIAVVPGRVAADVATAALECCRNDDLARAAIERGMSFTEAFRKFPKMWGCHAEAPARSLASSFLRSTCRQLRVARQAAARDCGLPARRHDRCLRAHLSGSVGGGAGSAGDHR
ncbi:MAG TPA: hypothetical protein VFZ94_15230, partial [Burkholderiales bacterium]